jgi:hypothetical protein
VLGILLRELCGAPGPGVVSQRAASRAPAGRLPLVCLCQRAARCRLRLRGGADAAPLMPRQAPTGVLLLPEDTEHLQDAVRIVEQHQDLRGAGAVSGGGPATFEGGPDANEILVGGNMPEDSREWGTPHDGFTPLIIRGAMSLRMEDGVNLRGPMDLQPSSSGMLLRWKWGCSLNLNLRQEAALCVAGGPWYMNRCVLRAADMPVVRAFGAANLTLHDDFVGGFSSLTSRLEGAPPGGSNSMRADSEDHGAATRCTQALLLEGNTSTAASDCTLQFCGAWDSSAALVGGAARLRMAQCFLFQNLGCGISIHEAADVEVVQCSFVQVDGGCFRAVLAQRAALRVSNMTSEGLEWYFVSFVVFYFDIHRVSRVALALPFVFLITTPRSFYFFIF